MMIANEINCQESQNMKAAQTQIVKTESFAVVVKRGATGKYTSRSCLGSSLKDYQYNHGIGDGKAQAMAHVELHLQKFNVKPNRRIELSESPDGKGWIAMVLPEIDPKKQFTISATEWYSDKGYAIHRVRVYRNGEELINVEGSGGCGYFYQTAYLAMVAKGYVEKLDNHGATVGSLYWREELEALDHGVTEVPRRKDM